MQAEINEVLAKHGMSQFSGLKYAFAQMIPMLFFFVSVNRMSDGESVKADFMTGGLGWFTDLSAADPYYIFPLFAVATMFATFYLNPSTKAPPSWLKYVLVAGGAFTFYFTSAMPAVRPFLFALPRRLLRQTNSVIAFHRQAVHMYWAVTNVFTLVTFALLRIPSVRLKLGIPLGAVDAIKGDYVKLLNSRPKTNITSDPNPTNAGTPNPPGRRKRN
jgi:YidC/Oxa1 family membrane protein insertase